MEAKFHEKMRKTLSLILALVLAFSLAAVPAFAADTTEAETSTSDTAYGQLHNGLLSEILSRIDIANDDNLSTVSSAWTWAICSRTSPATITNMHGIITITGNTVNINFGQVIGDIAPAARTARPPSRRLPRS